jgi:hypothetical protein
MPIPVSDTSKRQPKSFQRAQIVRAFLRGLSAEGRLGRLRRHGLTYEAERQATGKQRELAGAPRKVKAHDVCPW